MSFSNILSFLWQAIYKLDRNGRCKAIRQKDLSKCMDVRDFKFEYFRYMCIISGCDYLANIPGIGIKRAHTFVQRFATSKLKIEEVNR